MLFGNTFRFPADRTPDFPPECVVCGADPCGQTVRLGARTWSFLGLIPDKRVELSVPACSSCGVRLNLKRWARMGLFAGALIGAAVLTYSELDPGLRLRKLMAIGAGLAAALVTALACEWLLPLPIDVDPEDKGRTIELEVRDITYAARLIIRNPWIEMKGTESAPDEDGDV